MVLTKATVQVGSAWWGAISIETAPVQTIRKTSWNVDRPRIVILKLSDSRKTASLNLLWSFYNQEVMTEMTASHQVWRQKASLSDFYYVTWQKGHSIAFPKTKSQQPCYQTTDKGIPVWPTPSNPQCISTGAATVWQGPWQQQCCPVTWLRDKTNTRSRVKWQKSLALWNARAVQFNWEPVRLKSFGFKHKQAQSFFMGLLGTPAPSPEACGAVGCTVSVHISKYDD